MASFFQLGITPTQSNIGNGSDYMQVGSQQFGKGAEEISKAVSGLKDSYQNYNNAALLGGLLKAGSYQGMQNFLGSSEAAKYIANANADTIQKAFEDRRNQITDDANLDKAAMWEQYNSLGADRNRLQEAARSGNQKRYEAELAAFRAKYPNLRTDVYDLAAKEDWNAAHLSQANANQANSNAYKNTAITRMTEKDWEEKRRTEELMAQLFGGSITKEGAITPFKNAYDSALAQKDYRKAELIRRAYQQKFGSDPTNTVIQSFDLERNEAEKQIKALNAAIEKDKQNSNSPAYAGDTSLQSNAEKRIKEEAENTDPQYEMQTDIKGNPLDLSKSTPEQRAYVAQLFNAAQAGKIPWSALEQGIYNTDGATAATSQIAKAARANTAKLLGIDPSKVPEGVNVQDIIGDKGFFGNVFTSGKTLRYDQIPIAQTNLRAALLMEQAKENPDPQRIAALTQQIADQDAAKQAMLAEAQATGMGGPLANTPVGTPNAASTAEAYGGNVVAPGAAAAALNNGSLSPAARNEMGTIGANVNNGSLASKVLGSMDPGMRILVSQPGATALEKGQNLAKEYTPATIESIVDHSKAQITRLKNELATGNKAIGRIAKLIDSGKLNTMSAAEAWKYASGGDNYEVTIDGKKTTVSREFIDGTIAEIARVRGIPMEIAAMALVDTISNSHFREFSTDAGSIRLNVGKADEVSVQYSTAFIDMAEQWLKLDETQKNIEAAGKKASESAAALKGSRTTYLSEKEQFGLAYTLSQQLSSLIHYKNTLSNVKKKPSEK